MLTSSVGRKLAHEHGRQHWHEALLDEPRKRPAVERELEQGKVADAVDEAAARDLRGALGIDPTHRLGEIEMVADREVEARRLAPAADLDGVLLGVAVGRRHVRRVGDAIEDLLPARLGLAELVLQPLQLALEPLELGELLGRRLALDLPPGPQILDLRLHLEDCAVGGEQLVEELAGSFARQRLAHLLRRCTGCPEVDHATESK